MATFTNQQNGKKEPSVNTNNVMQFYNRNSVTCPGSTLVLNMWNQNIKLEMHPMKAKQDNSGVFDYNVTMNLVVPAANALAIAEDALPKIIEAIKESKPLDISYQIGISDKLIQFTVIQDENSINHVVVTIIRGINTQTLECEGALSYEFNIGTKINNLNSKNITIEPIQNEMMYFFAAFKALAIGCVGAENHGRKFTDQHWNTAIYTLYKGIAAKMGIDMWNGDSVSTKLYSSNRGFSMGGGQQSSVKQPFSQDQKVEDQQFQGIKEVDSLDDLAI